jgi:ABC-type multidrug transport system ATPase subunit
MDPVIRFDQVTKCFGSQTALDRVSLTVPPGIVFALLGENGAGKTTAIRIMLGLLETDAGKSTVLGRDSLREGLEIRRRVGYVPERPTLYEWMTVLEIGWFTAGFYGERFLPRYRELVAQYKLPERRKLKSLSKGMRAKVALSLAMAHDPELLVLDEPTSGLDTLVRREFLENMVDLAAAGRTVLLSSHQIGEVERVADIVAIIKDGKLAARRSARRPEGPDSPTHDHAQRGRDRPTADHGRNHPPAAKGPAMADPRPRPATRRTRIALRPRGGLRPRIAHAEPGGDFRGVHASRHGAGEAERSDASDRELIRPVRLSPTLRGLEGRRAVPRLAKISAD